MKYLIVFLMTTSCALLPSRHEKVCADHKGLRYQGELFTFCKDGTVYRDHGDYFEESSGGN
jgi:hypothetical protein